MHGSSRALAHKRVTIQKLYFPALCVPRHHFYTFVYTWWIVVVFFNKEDIWILKLQNHLQLQEPPSDQNKPCCLLQVMSEAAFSGPGTQQAFLRAGLLHDEQLLTTILLPQHVCCSFGKAPPPLVLLLIRGSDYPGHTAAGKTMSRYRHIK